jgi:hypothetical protein
MSDNTTVNICGILYRIQRPEAWAVVFTQDQPIGMRPTRFMLHRDIHSLWQFQPTEGWGDVPCHHITAAHEWCRARVGDDHAVDLLPQDDLVPHQWDYDGERRMTYCRACGRDMRNDVMYRSCEPKVVKTTGAER